MAPTSQDDEETAPAAPTGLKAALQAKALRKTPKPDPPVKAADQTQKDVESPAPAPLGLQAALLAKMKKVPEEQPQEANETPEPAPTGLKSALLAKTLKKASEAESAPPSPPTEITPSLNLSFDTNVLVPVTKDPISLYKGESPKKDGKLQTGVADEFSSDLLNLMDSFKYEMYKVEIPQDTLQQAALERRRRLDEERKKRIFDPKARILGIDIKSLDEQIRLKNESKLIDKQRDLAFDTQMKYTNAILDTLDAQSQLSRRQVLLDTNEFRSKYQRPEMRRDFDLQDPLERRKSAEERAREMEASRGAVSGMQSFEGEDAAAKTRMKLQQQQMRIWTQEQMYLKEQARLADQQETQKYVEYQESVNRKMEAMCIALEESKKEQARLDKEKNRELARLKKEREEEEKRAETEANFREIISNVNGQLLSETPDVFNVGMGHKVRVDLFKGMTPEQKREVLKTQELQRLEAESKREQTRAEETRWALQQAANLRATMLMEREKQRRAREVAIQIRRENEMLAAE
ncbi:Protein Tax-1, partial [Chytridiales sp. JEL 0842]